MIFKKPFAAMLFVVIAGTFSTRICRAAGTSLDADQMKVVLETATPEEDGFIETVLLLVDEGKLSRATVESTFLWARTKHGRRFQYFKHGLLARLPSGQLPTPNPPDPPKSDSLLINVARWLFQRVHISTGGS